MGDVGIAQQEIVRRLGRRSALIDALAASPRACRSSRAAAACPAITVSRLGASGRGALLARIGAVPSLLWSSTRMTRNAPG